MRIYQVDIEQAKAFLLDLLKRSVSLQALDWVEEKLQKITSASTYSELYLAFSAAPRFVGKGKLEVRTQDLEKAEILRKGFNPTTWTTDQAARAILLLATPHQEKESFLKAIHQLFSTAEMGELVALYASLPLLPYPEEYVLRAAEGVRSNIGTVFDAIALDNPYPADFLEEGAWNQLVLKTVFVGKPLFCIYGLEKRANPTLARILSDYAHERWAAGRTVTPELWRPVGPFLNQELIEDIKRLFDQPDQLQQEAAALACAQVEFLPAQELLAAHPALKNRIETGDLTWNYIGTQALTKE